jgi:hypothetical protein
MWPVCIWQMEVNGFKTLAFSQALASTRSEKGYVVVTGLIAMPEETPDPVLWQRFLGNVMKAIAQNGGSSTPFYHIDFSLLSPSLADNDNFGWFKPLADATGYDGSFDQYAVMWGNNEGLPEVAQDTFFMGRIYDYGHWTKK